MKIPIYHTNKNGKQNRKLNNFLVEDYRMLITGQSKCGKRNILIHILRTPLVYYDKTYLCTPNQHQDKIQDLEKIMDKIFDEYLLLAEFSVRTVNYGPSFFLSIYGPSAKGAGHKSMEKNEDP